MPSARRIRLLTLAVAVTVVFFIYYSSSSNTPSSTFYQRTVNALHPDGQTIVNSRTGKKTGQIPADRDADGDIDEDDEKSKQKLVDSLGQAAQDAQEKANKKAPVKPDIPSKLVGVGNSRGGANGAGDAPAVPAADVEAKGNSDAMKHASPEQLAKIELAAILKKSPVVIFSKSYCPHSKNAKGLLLSKYTIVPKPYVVELDQHSIGSALQDLLLEQTGRRTVPNIVINGVSLGGNSEIVEFDEANELSAQIQKLGGSQVEVSKTLVEEHVQGADPY